MRRWKTSDWDHVGWHYKAIHTLGTPVHNRLLIRAKGMENLPREGGFLYAANHTSWWDPIVLQTTCPRPVNWLAKKEMMNNAFNKWFFFDKGGCIPVDRNTKNPDAYAAAVKALREDRIIGIFPEMTRYAGKLGPAKTGVARLAMEAGVPVVPAAILTDKFWPPGQKAPKLGEPIYLHVGPAMHLKGEPRAETDRVMASIEDLMNGARAARARGEKWAAPTGATFR